ncbi:hypothetical protein CMO91_04470 [Candidatus Woesearchaeota archaeon]|nr:hypothetical protein [Candidatus Woesearchaeota archaeon]|tara:strand:- start:13 stop:525 length:513 start_codon:yes stop_codon:yes gene_type:complete
MRFQFVLEGNNSDMVLQCDGSSYNIGYLYTTKLPIMITLYQRQIGIPTSLEGMVPDVPYEHDHDLEDELEDAEELVGGLPFSDFNNAAYDFLRFTNGLHNTSYEFRLVEDALHLFRTYKREDDATKILEIQRSEVDSFLQTYVDFIGKENRLRKFRDHLCRIASFFGTAG